MFGSDSLGNRYCFDKRVCVVKAGQDAYREPERLLRGLERNAGLLGWKDRRGSLLGNAIGFGDRVVLKPNLVIHRNQGPWGLEPLLTNADLIRLMARSALKSHASQVLVGDAPLQSCDFDSLLEDSGLQEVLRGLAGFDSRFAGITDFRRTTCDFVAGIRVPDEALRPMDRFVLFDLGEDSLLEEVTGDDHPFRVTCYDPDLLAKTHSLGTHQYLVAREVMEADLVVNMPKLKTHKKAGMTCALKNLIGINGNKEYLPHHRLGGSDSGGDCYPGKGRLKSALEYALDRMNRASTFSKAFIWGKAAERLAAAVNVSGDRIGVEGSWSGNNTIWRTCLDLNRILLYGKSDGTIAETPQRKVIHVVDAIVAGQGEGPLKPRPLPMGLIVAGYNPAAIDWVCASLLGYDPNRIPIVSKAFDQFRWPLVNFCPDEITLLGDLGTRMDTVRDYAGGFEVEYPIGWRDAAIGRAPKCESPEVPEDCDSASGQER